MQLRSAAVITFLQPGQLTIRIPHVSALQNRDRFVKLITAFVHNLGNPELTDALSKEVEQSRIIEALYHRLSVQVDQVLRGVGKSLGMTVWSCIFLAHREMMRGRSDALKNIASLDPISSRLVLSCAPDAPMTFGNLANAVDMILAKQLMVFGHRENLFENMGRIVVPKEVVPDDTRKAEELREIAAKWFQIERSELICRLFDGRVSKQLAPNPQKTDSTIEVNLFEIPCGWELAIHVAGMRLTRIVQTAKAKLTESKQGDEHLLKGDALAEFKLVKTLLGPSVDSTPIGGLNIREWLLGYQVLKQVSQRFLEGKDCNTPCLLFAERLADCLVEAGFATKDRAELFIANVTFSKDSVDLHDCPIIEVEGNKLHLAVFAGTAQSSARLLLSQASRFGVDFSEKGKFLEAQVITCFRNVGIKAVGLNRFRVDKEDVEIDCLALWDGVLFIIECKNCSFPKESVVSQYNFIKRQADAADQVNRVARIIRSNPWIVKKAFGEDVTWTRIVPIVVNGLPFSLPNQLTGVYFFDFASLTTFFQSGVVRRMSKEVELPDVPEEGAPIPLWTDGKPSLSDFLIQLDKNALFELTARYFVISPFPLPIDKSCAVVTSRVCEEESVLDQFCSLIDRKRRADR